MSKININEYLINLQGLRLDTTDVDMNSFEYSNLVANVISGNVPQIYSVFAESEKDTVDVVLDKLQLMYDSPSITAQHIKFEAYMNRFTWSYADCPAKPKSILMKVINPNAYLYDNKIEVNRLGVHTLSLHYDPFVGDYVLDTLIVYDSNPDNNSTEFRTTTGEFKVKCTYDNNRKVFDLEIMQDIPTGKYLRFLQNCRFDVYVNWSGSDFIDRERDMFVLGGDRNILNIDDVINYVVEDGIPTNVIKDITDDCNFRVQKYCDKYVVINDANLGASIVSDSLISTYFDSQTNTFRISNASFVVLSNFTGSIPYNFDISGVDNLIMINCMIGNFKSSTSNITFIGCDCAAELPMFRFSDSNVKFEHCDFGYLCNAAVNNTFIDTDKYSTIHFYKSSVVALDRFDGVQMLFSIYGKCTIEESSVMIINPSTIQNNIAAALEMNYVNSTFAYMDSENHMHRSNKLWEVS